MSYKWKYWEIPADISFLNFRVNEPDLKDAYGSSILGDYFQGWQSLYQYCYDVLSGKRTAGLAEIAACERFVYDLNREDLYFDKEEVDFAMLCSNELKHPKGPIAGTPFRLMGWMQFIIGQIYGWFYSSKARETLRGDRRYQKSFIAVARGNSKTVLGAAAIVIQMLTTQNGSPIATTSATVQRQSRIAYEDVAKMLKSASPSIRKRFNVLQNEIRSVSNSGKIIATSSESETLDGLRITFALCDEIHAHKNSKIVDVLSTGLQSSKDPHLMCITTAGVDTQSYGREYMDYAEEVSRNVMENDRLLAVIYQSDKDDDWADESIWEKANPALGHAVSLESLRAAYVEATRNAQAAANFKTKHLNIWVDFSEDSFIEATELYECRESGINISDYKNRECYLGLDLASVSDLSSLVYIFPENDGGITVFQKSYLPEGAVIEAKPSVQDRYYNASKNGELILTPTEVTDFTYIKNDIENAYKDFDIQSLSLDAAAGGLRFAEELTEEYGYEPIAVKQGFGLSESAVLLQSLVKSKKFKYDSNLLEWCFINAVSQEGQYGDIKVIRPKNDLTKKIDICVAALIGLSNTILQENKMSVYEHQDIRFL
ncbi:terminase large subunit [Vibrio sp. ER1A]|uniref:terminase large subunit n=1 Tax=Vibrio sp. ER1A TaxID=1517681 RepID=UPI0004DD873D|nr:terminase TerL endonuclease subunit [Vibrio sp. ER1A]KFA99259.1 hypothetical protein HW45_04875 [Vibrio sp. ER1A]